MCRGKPSDTRIRISTAALREIDNDLVLGLFVLEDFLEKILDVEDFLGDVAHQLLKTAMLLARDLPEEDVVEQQLGHHRRNHHVDLASGKVDEDALEPADFARDVQPHASRILPLE